VASKNEHASKKLGRKPLIKTNLYGNDTIILPQIPLTQAVPIAGFLTTL
jgi:hypothetical protein